MVTHLLSHKGNEKKTLIKEKKRTRKRTVYTKNESNVRPTLLIRVQKEDELFILCIQHFVLPEIIKKTNRILLGANCRKEKK